MTQSYTGFFTFEYQEKQYTTKQFPISQQEFVKERLPESATKISLHVLCNGRAISGEEEYKLVPENFPDGAPDGAGHYVLSEKGQHEVEIIKQEAIAQHVNLELDAYRAKLLVLTRGKRSTMLLRDLAPLEREARMWAQHATHEDIAICKAQACEVLSSLFQNVNKSADLVKAITHEPSEYDDSELALGKQRIAQIDRLANKTPSKWDDI